MADGVVFNRYSIRREDGERILIYTGKGLFEFNEMAFTVMSLLEDNYELDTIYQKLASEYAVSVEVLKEDIDDVIAQFVDCGLVRRSVT
jgi:hypothetical protein